MATAVAEKNEQQDDQYDLNTGETTTEMPEKASQKQLYIRRALEDRAEKKRLKAMSDDNYWDNL
ncbi:hypothetical protein M3P05_01405 [Sansalvadorimonas sp. 2012CJ34-2]|uniref:Uncharacterized protein n=1 Tax=Parendozoicomonas callyspongiae TaxID=2942213 RepID=A0ABT0PB65_9GAMM|nr:hypothetical protein [Sansalvadorimonas sp. 2012CJ34-2]MCL6268610.1 hypothetical protein [Sansalvadorimonas sp. 2012CJ34-2]